MKKEQKAVGELAVKLRMAKGWSEGQLSSEIMIRYGDPITPKAIRALESGGHGTLRLVTLVFGALRNLRKDQLNAYFTDMLGQMTDDQSIKNRQGTGTTTPRSTAEL